MHFETSENENFTIKKLKNYHLNQFRKPLIEKLYK